jgi:putative transposase
LQRWLERAAVRTLYIQKASPWENGYVESSNGKLRDELLNRELFLSIPEVSYVLDEWRWKHNHRRPHSGLKWQTPAAYAAKFVDRQAGAFPAASHVESPVGAAHLPPTPHVN